ncbi:hypothetical protein HY967_02855 [Candidatus Jorgensenbacteria bacterium]|nr:hypothetical protein [Candidatus Jorgensenbacteria bacterium]
MKSLKTFLSLIFVTVLFVFLIIYGGRMTQLLINLIGSTNTSMTAVNNDAWRLLMLENESLRREIAALKDRDGGINDYIKLKVYSRYPFNDRSSIVIDGGTDQGILVGAPVLIGDGVLLGKVKSVWQTQSEIMTIFDPDWKSSVVVGDGKTKALLRGGEQPRLEFIPRDNHLKEADSVFNISPELPLHRVIGSLGKIKDLSREVWLSANIEMPYHVEDVLEVTVIKNFP